MLTPADEKPAPLVGGGPRGRFTMRIKGRKARAIARVTAVPAVVETPAGDVLVVAEPKTRKTRTKRKQSAKGAR